jgi:hypothetical protein
MITLEVYGEAIPERQRDATEEVAALIPGRATMNDRSEVSVDRWSVSGTCSSRDSLWADLYALRVCDRTDTRDFPCLL